MKGSAHKIEATKKNLKNIFFSKVFPILSQKVFPILLDTSLYPLM